MRKHVLAAIALFCVGLAPPAFADQKTCQLLELIRLGMSTDFTGRVGVPMTINGRTANLLIDTGGAMSTLTQSTAAGLGLSPKMTPGLRGIYYGGEVVDHYVIVRDSVFGGVRAPELVFFIMSDRRVSADEDGTLSPDIISRFDADFDFANSRFSLFSQDHCPHNVVYWTKDAYARIEFRTDSAKHIRVPVHLDGKEIVVDIDTGAMDSVGSLDDIEDAFGIDTKNPALKLVSDANGRFHMYRYPFKTLSFEGVAVYNPDLNLRPDRETHTRHKFLLGMNVLRWLHLFVAYGEHAIYVTPATAH